MLVRWPRPSPVMFLLMTLVFFVFLKLLSAVAVWCHLGKLCKTKYLDCGAFAALEGNGLGFALG